MLVIPGLMRLKQEDCFEFKVRLCNPVSMRPVWAKEAEFLIAN